MSPIIFYTKFGRIKLSNLKKCDCLLQAKQIGEKREQEETNTVYIVLKSKV